MPGVGQWKFKHFLSMGLGTKIYSYTDSFILLLFERGTPEEDSKFTGVEQDWGLISLPCNFVSL